MNKSELDKNDSGTIAALLERARIRIPNLLEMKQRLLEGDTLGDIEIEEMHLIFEHAREVLEVFDRHPELQQMYTKMVSLYKEITQLALDNARTGN